ncbi:MAG TPA: hypothetical protein VK827_07710, partial [Lysobacter sp.]|nr:hypothetical protein [Lysobacter sp.]
RVIFSVRRGGLVDRQWRVGGNADVGELSRLAEPAPAPAPADAAHWTFLSAAHQLPPCQDH